MKAPFIILAVVLLFTISSRCQPMPNAVEDSIPVCCHLTAPDYEFSGLAKWRNYVLLIPQHVKINDVHQVIALDTVAINAVLQHSADSVVKYTTVVLDTSLNSVIRTIQNAIGTHNSYGGFEAAVAVGDTLFFTAETDSICYAIKGIITQQANTIRVMFNAKNILPLPKPDYRFANAGFESLAYLPAGKKLVAFYENNHLAGMSTGYLFNTNFSGIQSLWFTTPLLFRLTDVTAIKDSAGNDALLGINFFYNDFKRDTGKKTTEFDYYLTGDTVKTYNSRQLLAAQQEMKDGNLLKNCFSRIVSLHINGNQVSWKEEKVISYHCNNWEGITPYKNGVLMIIDGKPPGVNCRFAYFDLTKTP